MAIPIAAKAFFAQVRPPANSRDRAADHPVVPSANDPSASNPSDKQQKLPTPAGTSPLRIDNNSFAFAAASIRAALLLFLRQASRQVMI